MATDSDVFWSMRKVKPFNPMPDGVCRTLKYQYGKNSLANFIRGGAMGE